MNHRCASCSGVTPFRAAAEAERARAEADRKWRSLSESTDFIDDVADRRPIHPRGHLRPAVAPNGNP